MRGRRCLKEDLFRMRDAIDQYYADKGPVSVHARRAGERRLHAEVPDDPFTKSNSTLADRARRTRPEQPHRRAGVYDVKSGSDARPLSTARSTPTGRYGVCFGAALEQICPNPRYSQNPLANTAALNGLQRAMRI